MNASTILYDKRTRTDVHDLPDGKVLVVKLRYDDFRIVTRSITLPRPTRDPATIRLWAGRCLKTVPLDKRLRLIGVRMSALVAGDEPPAMAVAPSHDSLPLFDLPDSG